MAEHPNAQLVRRAYDAFQRGDLDGLRRDFFAADIKYHVPGRSQLAGDLEGADAVLDLFRKLFELTDGSYRVELHDVLATDEHAVALGRQFASRPGTSLEDIYCQVFHVRDGKLSEVWFFPYDPYQGDEFFGQR